MLTGWGNDLDGETGLAACYAAQLGTPPFFAAGFALLLSSLFFQPATLRSQIEAWVAGWQTGLHAEPLFGLDWAGLWGLPILDLRARLHLDGVRIVGEGVSVAA